MSTEPVAAEGMALVAEACKKSGLLWLDLPGSAQPRPAWHVWAAGAAFVVCGGQEQPLPGLETAEVVAVTVRSKDKGGRLVTWLASCRILAPGSPDWEAAVAELAGKRLNAPDAADQLARWARESAVLRLSPTGELVERPGSMPTDSGAATPVATPAVTTGPLPFVLGRGWRLRRRRAG